jgi:hypothetical protein
MTAQGCAPPAGYVQEPGDCNDYKPSIHPGAAEMCKDLDDDRDGLTDDDLPVRTIHEDSDGDGFAAVNTPSTRKCNVPVGWTTWNTPPDCDDSDITVYPGATDVCDGGRQLQAPIHDN